ncbi:hypothetical protein K503DRAFT_860996, partial [Rhizopogon vinicolor AM-OR11-026]
MADPGQDFAAEAIALFGTSKGKEKQVTPSQNDDKDDDEEDQVDVENRGEGDAEPLVGELKLGKILDGGMDYGDGDDSPVVNHDHGGPFMFDDNENPDWDNINPSEAPGPSSSHLPPAPSTMQLPQSITHHTQLPQPACRCPVVVPRLNMTQISHLPSYSLNSPERIRPLLSALASPELYLKIALFQQIQDMSVVKADNKCMKLDGRLLSRELKVCEAQAEREHALRSSMAAQTHERALADEWTKQLQLELELEK